MACEFQPRGMYALLSKSVVLTSMPNTTLVDLETHPLLAFLKVSDREGFPVSVRQGRKNETSFHSSSWITMTSIDKELESHIVLRDIADQKRHLDEILSRYGVQFPEDIEKGIKDGKFPEHPSWEDFLSALSILNSINEMKRLAKQLIEAF